MPEKNNQCRPTQEEAQFMIDWFNAVNEIHSGYLRLGSEYKEVFEMCDKFRSELWKKTFNELTRWKVEQKYFKNGRCKELVLVEVPDDQEYSW